MASPPDMDDKFIQQLNDRGFLPILHPAAGFVPPTFYLVEKDADQCMLHGTLNEVLFGLQTPPEKYVLDAKPQQSSEFERAAASTKDAKVSISLFEKIAKLCGMDSGPKLDAVAKAQDNANYSFGNVKSLLVEPAAIETVLNATATGKKTRIGDAILDRFKKTEFEDGLVHIAFQYLYSNSIEVRIGANLSGSLGIRATASNAGSVKAKLGAKGNDGAATLYKGEEPIAFAFRLAQVQRDGDRYFVRATRRQGSGVSATSALAEPYIVETGRVLEIVPQQDDGQSNG